MLTRIFIALFVMTASPALAAPLTADLSDHQIAIRSDFEGADLLLFGSLAHASEMQRADGNIIIVVEGPPKDITVRKKDRVGPIWVNRQSHDIAGVPGYYAVLSSAPLSSIAPPAVLNRHRIGLSHLNLQSGGNQAPGAKGFTDAVIRNMQRADLYTEQQNAIRFIGTDLFRAEIRLPANVPVGTYKVRAYLVRDGRILGAQFSPLFIDKTGFERSIYQMAQNYGWWYGLLAVALAAFFGWAAAAIFERR